MGKANRWIVVSNSIKEAIPSLPIQLDVLYDSCQIQYNCFVTPFVFELQMYGFGSTLVELTLSKVLPKVATLQTSNLTC